MRSASSASGGAKKTVEWTKELVLSEVDAHPDLLTVPTFILFVQKDELAMSRAEVRKLERRESQKEFEDWLYQQTQPRAPAITGWPRCGGQRVDGFAGGRRRAQGGAVIG